MLLLCLPFFAIAQDLDFKLAGATHKKWIGDNIIINTPAENNSTLIFDKNHTVIETSKYDSRKPLKHWKIAEGKYLNDENIILEIGKKQYHVEFSQTSNGKDFMTLSYGGDEGHLMIKTYHAE